MAFKDAVIQLYLSNPNRTIDNISKIAGCSNTLVHYIVTDYLKDKREAVNWVTPKPIVSPFVLISNNDKVNTLARKLGFIKN